MDKKEAKTILSEELAKYKSRSYAELESMVGSNENYERLAPSGKNYQIEIQIFFDDKTSRDIRVMGSIDDSGWRAFIPLTDSFIMTRDGRFVE